MDHQSPRALVTKRHLCSVIFSAALAAPFVAAGCQPAEPDAAEDGDTAAPIEVAPTTAVQAYCARMLACGLDGGETEQRCGARLDGTLGRLRDKPVCKNLAHRLENLMTCGADLSCDELGTRHPPGSCHAELGAVLGALIATQNQCAPELGDGMFAPGDGDACKANADCGEIACADGTKVHMCLRHRCVTTTRRACGGLFQGMFGHNGRP